MLQRLCLYILWGVKSNFKLKKKKEKNFDEIVEFGLDFWKQIEIEQKFQLVRSQCKIWMSWKMFYDPDPDQLLHTSAGT